MKRAIMICAALVLTVSAMAQDGKDYASGLGNGKNRKSVTYDNKYQNSGNFLTSVNSSRASKTSSTTSSEKDMLWHLTYLNSLKDGDKGAYGFGADGVDSNGGIGMSMRMTTNAFLVDTKELTIKTSFGVNYSCPIGDMGWFVFPIMVGGFGYDEHNIDMNTGKDNKKFKFGVDLEAMPLFAFGRNAGVSIGPYCIYSFVSEKTSWGGHVSIWF